MNTRLSVLLAALLGAAGATAGLWLVDESVQGVVEPADSRAGHRLAGLADTDSIDPEVLGILLSLEEALDEQMALTKALTRKVAALEAERGLPMVNLAEGMPAEYSAESTPGTEDVGSEAPARMSYRDRRREPVNVERLVAAGMNPVDAQEIVAAVDQIALDRMQLRYDATRDGTVNSDDYRQALADIPDVREFVQEEYGDDAYDRYLYASGRPNRVVVTDVLQQSAAQQIGLQTGDVLMALDDQRIYSSRDIMSIASESAGSVPLTVSRDGQVFRYYVESGPLGIRSERGYENPEPGEP